MIRLFRRKPKEAPVKKKRFWDGMKRNKPRPERKPKVEQIEWVQPVIEGMAMDNSLQTSFSRKGMVALGMPEQQADWFMSQGFIGYPMMAFIAKHWLVDKACGMPARDAIRQGFKLDCESMPELITALSDTDRDYGITALMEQYVHTGRRFGGAVALYVVESTDPEYYLHPYNEDGVTPGSYKGIKIIDPMHMHPVMEAGNVQDPASFSFMRPTHWRIGNHTYHHTHFEFFIPYPVADIAKPTYNYFGVSVPERIYERVYAAERTANEAPELAMAKRLGVIEIPDLEDVDLDDVYAQMEELQEFRDNFSALVVPGGSNYTQHDTSLADFDTVMMSQYQLVAAASNVIATKLLGTTPKGFNSTGEYEEAVYREDLETIQTNALDPMLQRHYDTLARSMGYGDQTVTIQWEALDSPTAVEYAQINLSKAQTAQAYHMTGAIDGFDIRQSIKDDPDGDFFGLEDVDYEDEGEAQEVGTESESNITGFTP